jgi:hypothetical protein
MRGKNWEERISKHPELRERFERIMDLVEDAAGDLEKADAAEERAIQELQKLGNEVMHGWARGQAHKKAETWQGQKGIQRKAKKNSTGTPGSGK